jgi:hypothetical protein
MDRNAPRMQELAGHHGHVLELHTGVMAGGAGRLRALIGRAELVVVVTDENSHNAVHAARREAKLLRRPLRIVRRMGPAQLASLLRDLPVASAA